MISAKGIKPKDETASVYPLPLYNLEQTKALVGINQLDRHIQYYCPGGAQNTPRRGTDEKKQLNKHYST